MRNLLTNAMVAEHVEEMQQVASNNEFRFPTLRAISRNAAFYADVVRTAAKEEFSMRRTLIAVHTLLNLGDLWAKYPLPAIHSGLNGFAQGFA